MTVSTYLIFALLTVAGASALTGQLVKIGGQWQMLICMTWFIAGIAISEARNRLSRAVHQQKSDSA